MSESVKGVVQAVSIRGDKDDPKKPIEGKFGTFYNVGLKIEDKWYNKTVMGDTQSEAGKQLMVFSGDTVELKVSENKIMKDGIKVTEKGNLRSADSKSSETQSSKSTKGYVQGKYTSNKATFVRDDFGPTFGGMAKIALDMLKHNNGEDRIEVDELMQLTSELTTRALWAKQDYNTVGLTRPPQAKAQPEQTEKSWD